jgi:phage-related protein
MEDWIQTPAKEMYLAEMGWHFNEKACEYAVQYLKDRNNKPIKPYSKEDVDELL